MAAFLISMKLLVEAIHRSINNMRWRRRNTPFMKENGYSYDMVMVMKVYEANVKLTKPQMKYTHEELILRINNAGLETELFFSVQHDELYIKIRIPFKRLKYWADKIDYKVRAYLLKISRTMFFWLSCQLTVSTSIMQQVELDPNVIGPMLEAGGKNAAGDLIWAPIKVEDTKGQCLTFNFHEFIFAPYEGDMNQLTAEDADEQQRMYKRHACHSGASIFRGVDRINIILNIIGAPVADGGCDLKPRELMHEKVLLAFYPLHDYIELSQIQKQWLKSVYAPKNQPIFMIRNYFGEKIALYFAWLGMYTTWLGYASVAGFISFIFIIFDDYNANSVIIVPFALFMAAWSTFYLEKWKVKEIRTAVRFGMVGFEDEEQDRPEFEGVFTKSPVDGKDMEYFKPSKRGQAYLYSMKYIIALAIGSMGVLSGVLALNYYLNGGKHGNIPDYGKGDKDDDIFAYDDGAVVLRTGGFAWGMIMVFSILALYIEISGGYFTDIAAQLTDGENHQTDTDYEDALVLKSFIFNFLNSYTSLFYIAFLARNAGQPCTGPDGKDDCMSAVNVALGTIFCCRLIVGNFQEVVIPLITTYLKAGAELAVADEDKERLMRVHGEVDESQPQSTAIEAQYVLEVYDTATSLYEDYLEMVLQVC